MDTQRWLRAGDIFDRVFASPRDNRTALVEELCGTDPDLKQIVVSMLDAEESPLDFLGAAVGTRDVGSAATTALTPDDADAPERVGPWCLVECLGDGGMGVVWLAERADGQFEQRAALKLIKRGMDSDAVLARFLRERQILARLQHPNIAHLLDGGIAADGRPYFAMEYVDGMPLLGYCHERGLDLEGRIRLFLDVCAAVEFAHQHHVVHRDLKPSNVLVTADGKVKLLDFGIAKMLVDSGTGDASLTQLRRERPMTPAYAAPEQFSGGRITEATDIYALGCVLYQLLTDKYAYDFRGANQPDEMRHIIEASDPTPPSKLRLTAPPVPPKRLRGDLDTIVLAALKHDPQRRYPSVAAFAEDLRSYLSGNPISARRDNFAYRGYKFLRRHRLGALATAAVLLMAVVALSLALRERRPFGPPAPGTSMAIVDFSNLSQNKQYDWISVALGNELATELTSGSVMHAVPGELVNAARAGLSPPSAGGYGPASLRLLRKRLNTDYVLSGSYLVSGAGDTANLRMDLTVQDARTEAPLASIAQSGALNDLPRLVEQVGAELRADLKLATNGATTPEQVAKAQPATFDLSRRMALALEAQRRGDPARARDELLQAIALAPGYAPAYVLLAQTWKTLGYDDKALAASRQAVAFSAGLPMQQQLQIDREVAVQTRDWPKALDLDRQLLALDPKDPELHFVMIKDLLNAGEPDKAEALLDQLRKLPGSADDPRIELKAVNIADSRNDNVALIKHAELALQLAQGRDEPGLTADAQYNLALARRLQGRRDEALTLLRRAIDGYRATDNPLYEADAHELAGNIEVEQSHPQAARDAYQKALAIYQRIGNRARLAISYSNLANMNWKLGDRDAAQIAVQNAESIYEEVGDIKGEGWVTARFAMMKMSEAASDDVIDDFRRAIALDERAHAQDQKISALLDYSEGLRLRGELGAAAKMCKQASQETLPSTDTFATGFADLQCAVIAFDRGDTPLAVRDFERGGKFAADAKDAQSIATSMLGLAGIDMAQGNWAGARDRLTQAIATLAGSEAVALQALAQSQLALCHEQLHQPEQRDRASSAARELRSRVTARLDASMVDISLLRLQGLNGDAQKAATALQTLADDAEKRHWVPIALEAQLAAVELLDRANDPDAAALRNRVEASARQYGFRGILQRLRASARSQH
ncbi:MAG: hypothetical protein DYH18_02050 [Xanthomonadales bacterium PRO7]|nr:hypothetical protein [Xanthomonadales bacterium PRO7]HMM56282.1 protein kinase [Rudaea sp.]